MLAILADDLTGALDAGAPFAARGMHVEIALCLESIGEALREGPDVVSISLGTRELNEADASLRTSATLASLPSGTRLFKKIDSRMKGNIAAELDSTPYTKALVAPAIPEFDRRVVTGHIEGFGIDEPISITSRLASHAARAVVPDVRSQSDMRQWLEWAERGNVDLLVGARGLAEALAERLTSSACVRRAEIPGCPTLLVIGSRDPITLRQIEELRAAHPLQYFAAPNGKLKECLSNMPVVTVVQAVPGEEVVTAADVSQALADSVFSGENNTTLVLSGGATAEAVLGTLRIKRFRLIGECLPGLGLAHAHGRCIIAKSGGFGAPDTLVKIVDEILRKMD
ncbi:MULTISPECIES: four-carbon acid sugar kinase family protein [unclassified Rhizobium]|uniref:four-carbon acid sugar kinase family protein n=1 Tax=unclassified Rhizobium TaxID=2613769 RepID=UPI000BD4A67A|nr:MULTISPECIES: four-carbon acid sugar kinase family protein [unclassified Rhizobium]MDH7809499.1 uncharacterized protein YgbK (DUF1537 family) [Rhizobium sp. AN67]MDQ4408748.1 four-carbon acid sugar kinase family protein [Rhizobium sp. AN63]SOD50411.1 Uncharacterized conserved protein YgbK, DUF1537 family [Rhizobium sp. AN6A]